jgi:hypothetical protein
MWTAYNSIPAGRQRLLAVGGNWGTEVMEQPPSLSQIDEVLAEARQIFPQEFPQLLIDVLTTPASRRPE